MTSPLFAANSPIRSKACSINSRVSSAAIKSRSVGGAAMLSAPISRFRDGPNQALRRTRRHRPPAAPVDADEHHHHGGRYADQARQDEGLQIAAEVGAHEAGEIGRRGGADLVRREDPPVDDAGLLAPERRADQ